jgi:hypothetical protein
MSVNELLPISQATRLFPGSPHVQTIRRWASEGVRGHKLEVTRVGAKIYVSPEQVERFIAAGNQPQGAMPCT